MRRFLFLLFLAFTGSTVSACRVPQAAANDKVTVGKPFANAPGDTVYVPLNWTPGAVQDGAGPITGYETYGTRTTPTPTFGTGLRTLPASARSDVIPVPMPARLIGGQTATGTACVRQKRSTTNQSSPYKCPSWSFTMELQPLPPVDSAWTGPPLTQIALSYRSPYTRHPFTDEPIMLGLAMPKFDSAGGLDTAYGVCVAVKTRTGRWVVRSTVADNNVQLRSFCNEAKDDFWPSGIVVSSHDYSLTAGEKADVAVADCLHFLIECGRVELCRIPRSYGCDGRGWRVVPGIELDKVFIVGAVSLPRPV